MDLATPCLLSDGPTRHPIGEAICTVVRISWPCWCHRHHRRLHHNWGWHYHWRCCGRRCRATHVMVGATPPSFVWRPSGDGTNRAIVRIHRPHRSGWLSDRWLRGWWLCDRWLRQRWLRDERRWWRGGSWCLGKGCRGHSCATPSCAHAAILLSIHGPQTLPIRESVIAIVW